MLRSNHWITPLLWACVTAATAAAQVDFDRDVRPLLAERCTKCHGGIRQEADLSFVSRQRAMASGVIVAGDSTASELVARVTATDPDDRMPPVGEAMSNAEVNLLRRWIDQGADWPDLPAFRTLSIDRPPATSG